MFGWLRRAKPATERLARPEPAPGQRIYAIGDVHGRLDLLEALLPKLRADAKAQTDGRQAILVFLGDLVDRGDHSREVLDLVLAEAWFWAEVVCLRGNHEAALLEFLETPERGAPWLGFGGKQTLASYGVPIPKAIRPDKAELEATAMALSRAMAEHVGFLNRMAPLFRSGDVVLAHAGIDPGVPLEAQTESALLWGRSDFLAAGPPPGLRVVHGHWDNPEPVVTPQRICVDTGAYYSGRLTAVRLDAGTELIRVDVFDL